MALISRGLLTGALRGADTALGRRADRREAERLAEEEARARAEAQKSDLMLKLQLALAQEGVNFGPGNDTPQNLMGLMSSAARARAQDAEMRASSAAKKGDVDSRLDFMAKHPEVIAAMEEAGLSLDQAFRQPESLSPIFSRIQQDREAVEERERKLKEEKAEAEIRRINSAAEKNRASIWQSQQSTSTGLTASQIGSAWQSEVDNLTRERRDLEELLADPMSMMGDEQRQLYEGRLENLTDENIDKMARQAVERRLKAVDSFSGGQQTGGLEGAREEAQGLKSAGATKEEAVLALVKLGYSEQDAQQAVNQEF